MAGGISQGNERVMNEKNKVLNPSDAFQKAKSIKEENKKIVLVGGCFDILHIGHITFLKNAKQKGDYLFVILENDKSIKKRKGPGRPLQNQMHRSEILSHLKTVDFIIPLGYMKSDNEYDELIFKLKPDIIAITKGDPAKTHKDRQAKQVGAEVVEVIDRIKDISTTDLLKKVKQ